MPREIILDTETTGLDPKTGDRVIEIGCVELVNRFPTGREFHRYINPERDVPSAAEAVHGLSTVFLKDKPVFARIADEFLDFIGEDTLVIHNASFDVGFLNAEFDRLGKARLASSRVLDTLELARRKHPAGPNSLDALCKRYQIDNSKRTKHGALMDSILLAEVYVELIGERQAALVLSNSEAANTGMSSRRQTGRAAQRPTLLPRRLTVEDEVAHKAFVATLGATAIWLSYSEAQEG